MRITKAKLKQMIKEELSSTKRKTRSSRRRRGLREARVRAPYDDFGPMEKKLFDKLEEAIRHMMEVDKLWFEHIYNDPSYNDPDGQITVPSKVLKAMGAHLEDVNIAIGGTPEAERGTAEKHYPGNHYDDDSKYFGDKE